LVVINLGIEFARAVLSGAVTCASQHTAGWAVPQTRAIKFFCKSKTGLYRWRRGATKTAAIVSRCRRAHYRV